MDVHTEYAPDYVAECLAALQVTGADNVGGPWRAIADPHAGPTQARGRGGVPVALGRRRRALAPARLRRPGRHRLSRRLAARGPSSASAASTRPWCATRTTSTTCASSGAAAGSGRSRAIRSSYRPRATLGQVFRQYLQYGYWKPFVMKKHGQPARLRQLVPALFVVGAGAVRAARRRRRLDRLAAGDAARRLRRRRSPAMTVAVLRDTPLPLAGGACACRR